MVALATQLLPIGIGALNVKCVPPQPARPRTVQVVAIAWFGVPHGFVHGSLKRLSTGALHVPPAGASQRHAQLAGGASGAARPS
jgi:hypothetical protein